MRTAQGPLSASQGGLPHYTRVRAHAHTHTHTHGAPRGFIPCPGSSSRQLREAHGQRPEQLLQGSGLRYLTQQAVCWETLRGSSQTWRLHRTPTPAVSRSCEDLRKVSVPR